MTKPRLLPRDGVTSFHMVSNVNWEAGGEQRAHTAHTGGLPLKSALLECVSPKAKYRMF